MIDGELYWKRDECRSTKQVGLDTSRTRTRCSPGKGEALLGETTCSIFARTNLGYFNQAACALLLPRPVDCVLRIRYTAAATRDTHTSKS